MILYHEYYLSKNFLKISRVSKQKQREVTGLFIEIHNTLSQELLIIFLKYIFPLFHNKALHITYRIRSLL